MQALSSTFIHKSQQNQFLNYYKIHILGFPKFLITNDGKFGLSISSNNMRRIEKTKNQNFMTHYRNDT